MEETVVATGVQYPTAVISIMAGVMVKILFDWLKNGRRNGKANGNDKMPQECKDMIVEIKTDIGVVKTDIGEVKKDQEHTRDAMVELSKNSSTSVVLLTQICDGQRDLTRALLDRVKN